MANLNDNQPVYKKYLNLAFIGLITIIICQIAGLDIKQTTSVSIIVLLISTTFFFWTRRLSFGFIGVSMLLLLGVLDIDHLLEYASFDIILFLIGMMIIVGYLERTHFFEFVMGRIIERTGKKGKLLIFTLLILASVSAALIDEVTSIIIIISIIIHLTSKYKVNPTPFILMAVFATNIGSSATVVGNPVGVMIALNGGLTFSDFLRWATPISFVSLMVGIAIMMTIFKKEIGEFDENLKKSPKEKKRGDPFYILTGKLLAPTLVFMLVFIGLILHSQIENLLGLKKNTMLIGFSLIGAGIAMLLSKDRAAELVERRVDWWTLVFFIFLFASVGSLEYTGVIDIFSSFIQKFTGNNIIVTMFIVLFLGGLLSAMLDNVLAVAIMIPIVKNIIAVNPAFAFPLWWSMLFGGTFFGNLTPIGSTANIVALGIMQKRKLDHIEFGYWIKIGLGVTLATVATAFILLILQLPLMANGG